MHRIENCHLISHASALRPPRGARCVHNGPGIGKVHGHNIQVSGGPSQSGFIIAVITIVQRDAMGNAAKFLYLLALRGKFNTVDKNLGCTVVANVFQFCHGQSPIQGHENSPQAAAGKLNFEYV